MSKSSWKNAPVWAKCLAKDADGQWYWFELNDVVAMGEDWNGRWCTDGKYELAVIEENNWRDTLEIRP